MGCAMANTRISGTIHRLAELDEPIAVVVYACVSEERLNDTRLDTLRSLDTFHDALSDTRYDGQTAGTTSGARASNGFEPSRHLVD